MLPLLAVLAITIPRTGHFVFPPGVVELSAELKVPEGARDLVISGHRNGTTLRLAPGFKGRAAIVCTRGTNVRLTGFSIDGRRAAFKDKTGLPPSNVTFADFYSRNGILAADVEGFSVHRVSFREIWGFAVLVNRSRRVRLDSLTVSDSGGTNALGRNNTTGGILFEEGTTDFEVRRCEFSRIAGNGIWTHSNYGSPRNQRGAFAENVFHHIGRDALQVGHATEIKVESNSGDHIGYPPEVVDIETGATPVGIDTSGNVDRTVYSRNRFEEVNGKCIDLDGFHDGDVTFNTCVNKGGPKDYPHGHFGIVVNNYNPDMQSVNIKIADNTIDGAKFGGIFLIGSHHTVIRNRLLNLNRAHCNESAAVFGCSAIQGEPDVLQSGIYLGRIAAEWAQKRADSSRGHVIRDNVITGYRMDTRCVMAAPGVSLAESAIENNTCRDIGSPQP